MRLLLAAFFSLTAVPALAGEDAFKPGKAIPDYGVIAEVPGMTPIPADAEFKIRYDIVDAGKPGELNRAIVTAARFINMHHAAGVDLENIELAIVVHGPAGDDLTNDAFYTAKHDQPNANAGLVTALSKHGVKFYMCGQSAAWRGISAEDLLPEVEMSLSAMTAHALLDAQGYVLNPF